MNFLEGVGVVAIGIGSLALCSSFRDIRALRSVAGLESDGSFSTLRGALLVAMMLLPLGYGIVGLSRLIAG